VEDYVPDWVSLAAHSARPQEWYKLRDAELRKRPGRKRCAEIWFEVECLKGLMNPKDSVIQVWLVEIQNRAIRGF
jgi:hypothetical protein